MASVTTEALTLYRAAYDVGRPNFSAAAAAASAASLLNAGLVLASFEESCFERNAASFGMNSRSS
jgi:hypothetical protein